MPEYSIGIFFLFSLRPFLLHTTFTRVNRTNRIPMSWQKLLRHITDDGYIIDGCKQVFRVMWDWEKYQVIKKNLMTILDTLSCLRKVTFWRKPLRNITIQLVHDFPVGIFLKKKFIKFFQSVCYHPRPRKLYNCIYFLSEN